MLVDIHTERELTMTEAAEVFFRRFRLIAKSKCQLRHVFPSICPHRTNRSPLKGYS